MEDTIPREGAEEIDLLCPELADEQLAQLASFGSRFSASASLLCRSLVALRLQCFVYSSYSFMAYSLPFKREHTISLSLDQRWPASPSNSQLEGAVGEKDYVSARTLALVGWKTCISALE